MDVAVRPPLAAPSGRLPGLEVRSGVRRAFRPPGVVVGLLALYACWGSSIPAMKLMVDGIPPLAGAGAVFTGGGVVLLVAGLSAARPSRAQVRQAAVSGLLMLVGGQGLGTVALTKLSASLAAVLVATVPLWMAVLARLRGARTGRAGLIRLLAGFTGVLIVLISAPSSALGASPLAVAGVLVAALCWAAGSLRSADTTVALADPRITSAIQLITGGTILLAFAAISGQLSGHALSHMSASSLEAAVFLMCIDSLAGFALYQHLLRTAPLRLVSSYSYATPIVAAAISIAIFGEHPWPGLGLGAAVIVAAVYSEIRARDHLPPS